MLLGGSALPLGLNKPATPHACGRLRCVACDFRVCVFDDSRWTPAVDYLFFRNATPDATKLGTQLVAAPGAAAVVAAPPAQPPPAPPAC